jgi:surface antigen
MPRGVQGSGPDGHLGWVLAVSSDGSTVTIRSQNWSARGVVTVHDVLVDGRVQFISPPITDAPSPGTKGQQPVAQ